MTKQAALKLLREKLNYYSVVHDASCLAVPKQHHRYLTGCTCGLANAMRVLAKEQAR